MNQESAIALYQPMLLRIALSIVDSIHDAEDIVQETLLKWLTVDQNNIQNTKAYLIKAVTNNCFKHLQSLKIRQAELIENINPSRLMEAWKDSEVLKFDFSNELKSALDVVHEKLAPVEKTVFVLREVFDFHYDDIQEIVGRKATNCRKLFSRAKEKISKEVEQVKIPQVRPGELFQNFQKAVNFGHLNDLIADLKKEISRHTES